MRGGHFSSSSSSLLTEGVLASEMVESLKEEFVEICDLISRSLSLIREIFLINGFDF